MIIDLQLFNFINGFAGKWQALDLLAIFFAVYSGYFLLGWLVLFLVKDVRKYWRMVVEAIIAALLVRFVVVEIFYWLHFRSRPFLQLGTQLIEYDPSQTSFPSGHASFYFALSTIIYAYHKRVGIAFYIVTFLMVLSRVFVGVHWPSDILAGMLVGITLGWVLTWAFKKLTKHR